MLRLVIVDTTAESRNSMVTHLTNLLNSDTPDLSLLPRITVQPLTVRELRFHSAPDICIVGDKLIGAEISEVANIRKLLPNTPIIARLTGKQEKLETIEHLARMGVDDTISENIIASEFFKKLVLLIRRRSKTKTGQLIVIDGGKGGVGVTSVAAGISDSLVSNGKNVAVADFDFETQDLSRFLQARPFLNENLQLIFNQERPVTEEFVRQTLVQVWGAEGRLSCMSPFYESEELYDARSTYPRVLISILELLDNIFDCVVIDTGSARGAMLKTLYRVADKIVFVVNNNPACLYASIDKLIKIQSMMAPSAELLIVNNAPAKHGLKQKFIADELVAGARLSPNDWHDESIPYSLKAQRWPGGGGTIYSDGGSSVQAAIDSVLIKFGIIQPTKKNDSSVNLFGCIKKFKERMFGRLLSVENAEPPLLGDAQKLLPEKAFHQETEIEGSLIQKPTFLENRYLGEEKVIMFERSEPGEFEVGGLLKKANVS